MQVAVTTRHGSISEDKRQSIITKSEKLLTYFERVTSIQVTIDFEKDRTAIEMLVDTEHRRNFIAREVGTDVLTTFDQAMRKMEQQIRKHKEKLQERRRGRATIDVSEDEVLADDIAADVGEA